MARDPERPFIGMTADTSVVSGSSATGEDVGHLRCRDLFTFLKSLAPSVTDKLYIHPATCLVVFRNLPELSRHFIMRLLFVEQPVAQAVVKQWIRCDAEVDYQEIVETLSNLRLWSQQPVVGGMPGWILNPTFREGLKSSLVGGGPAWIIGLKPTAGKHAPDVSALDAYATKRWECVLHFMVGSSEGSDGVNQDIIDVLLQANVMTSDPGEVLPVITRRGFQFLLMDAGSQVWYFLLHYLDSVHSHGMDLSECLTLLFQLPFSTLGQDYSTAGMSERQVKFLQHLREIGLVYQRKRRSQRFYPTRLAVDLVSGMRPSRHKSGRSGYLVVETNYRVYAYTDSPMQVALIALFCELLYRFPNMVVSNLTRDSVKAALSRGITAEQILNYLCSHAHPSMLQKKPILPATITDQIRLWELERERLTFTEGVMYNQFLSANDFETLRDYAKELDVLVWDMPEKRVMIVSKDGHDAVKRFWKRQRQSW